MEETIYLDYAATTPVDERVLKFMLPFLNQTFGNPSSIHLFGQRAENAIEVARETVAGVLKCRPDEIIFTSCGSESDNLALRGVCFAMREKMNKNQILTSLAEHHAVSRTAGQMAELFGFDVEWLGVDEFGMVSPQTITRGINNKTALVSVMLANNEIGTINPISEISEICHKQGVFLHTDAVQAAAYLPLDVDVLGVDLLSLGGHKFYGPKGIGVLYVRKGTPIFPIQTGGSQEFGLRAGTQNVPYIVGFAEALRLTELEREKRTNHVKPMQDRIIGSVLENIPDTKLTGHLEHRLPNHCSFAFKGVDGNLLLTLLDSAGFACSSGSACKTGNPEPSEVMNLLQLPSEWGLGSLRITLGEATTIDEVEKFLANLPMLVSKARNLK
ncbi:MAG: cysteine desulfurase family protein [Chloroflexota bacterium]